MPRWHPQRDRSPAAEARELRRRAEELRLRAARFDGCGFKQFAADAHRLVGELYARADRLDPRASGFRQPDLARFFPPRGGRA